MNDAADVAATILLGAIGLWAAIRILMWLADKAIAAVDYLTRNE